VWDGRIRDPGPGCITSAATPVIGDLTFNTTDGDIVVVVDGDFDIGNNDITVEDGRNNVTYYINGSLDLQGGRTVGTVSAIREPERVLRQRGFLDGSAGTETRPSRRSSTPRTRTS